MSSSTGGISETIGEHHCSNDVGLVTGLKVGFYPVALKGFRVHLSLSAGLARNVGGQLS